MTEPTAGIAGCAKDFVEADGICRPSSDKCKAGSIPDFATGCAPVGISKCAAIFQGSDGFCHPTMTKCSDGTFAVPSEGCVSIDGANGCGSGTFGAITAMASDQYVDLNYVGGASDGSATAPWTTIADGLAHATGGARVVLAAGNYAEAIQPTADVKIVGRCASMVTISGTVVASNEEPAIVVMPATPHALGLQGVTLNGAGVGVFASGGTLDAEEVVVANAVLEGFILGNTTATLHHVYVNGVTASAAGQDGGGVDVTSGGHLTVTGSTFANVLSWGLLVEFSQATLTVSDTLVENVGLQENAGQAGYGIIASSDGSAKVDNAAVVHAAGIGMAATDGLSMNVTDSLIEASGPSALSHAIDVERSMTVNPAMDFTGDGLAILSTRGFGVVAGALGKTSLTRSLVTKSTPAVGSTVGGFAVESGAALTATDCAVVDNQGPGLYASDAGTTFTLNGVLIEGTSEVPGNSTDVGEGITCKTSAIGKVTNSAVIRATIAGLFAYESGTLDVDHTLVSNTLVSSVKAPGVAGVGVDGYEGDVTLAATRVEKSLAAGISLLGTTAKLSDVVVDGVGTGIIVVRDGSALIQGAGEGVLISRNPSQPTTIERAWVTGAARAGFLFASSQGSIDSSHADKCLYGIVTEGSPTPTIGTDNEFSGTTMDRVANGMLSAP